MVPDSIKVNCANSQSEQFGQTNSRLFPGKIFQMVDTTQDKSKELIWHEPCTKGLAKFCWRLVENPLTEIRLETDES